MTAQFDRLPDWRFSWSCLFFDDRRVTAPRLIGLGGGVLDCSLVTFDPTPIPNVADDGRVILTLRHPPVP